MAELNEIHIREHDQLAGIKRVSLFPSSSQTKLDSTSTSSVVYVGKAGSGVATSALKSWFLEKVDYSSGVSITHAVDSWDNRVTASYA